MNQSPGATCLDRRPISKCKKATSLSRHTVDQKRGCREQKFTQHTRNFGRKGGLFHRSSHKHDPSIAGLLIDRKWAVPHTQSRMPRLLQIARGTAETHDQEIPQPLLGPSQIVRGIHRPKDIVLRHAGIKCAYQSRKTFFADCRIDLLVVHHDHANRTARHLMTRRMAISRDSIRAWPGWHESVHTAEGRGNDSPLMQKEDEPDGSGGRAPATAALVRLRPGRRRPPPPDRRSRES